LAAPTEVSKSKEDLERENQELKSKVAILESRAETHEQTVANFSSNNVKLSKMLEESQAEKEKVVGKHERKRLMSDELAEQIKEKRSIHNATDLQFRLKEKEDEVQELRRVVHAHLKEKIEELEHEKAVLESQITDQEAKLCADERMIKHLENMPGVGVAIVAKALTRSVGRSCRS